MKEKLLLSIITITFLFIAGCEKEPEENPKPVITLKSGEYTQNEDLVPIGGKLKFGIIVSDESAIITNLRIQRVADGKTITELDKGLYVDTGNMDFEYNAVKSESVKEIWNFFVMNSNRDSAIVSLTVFLGEGSDWGEINHYSSLLIGMQANTDLPNFLDLHTGNLYNKTGVSGYEGSIDLVGFVYTTSGIVSPTLCCPGYTGSSSVTGFYPEILSWDTKNLTVYDYFSSDNNLVDVDEFNLAQNDSLLVNSFKPEKVSGLCKYCKTGRIVPFKTSDGKYGLVHVLHASDTDTGFMELEIKIQK